MGRIQPGGEKPRSYRIWVLVGVALAGGLLAALLTPSIFGTDPTPARLKSKEAAEEHLKTVGSEEPMEDLQEYSSKNVKVKFNPAPEGARVREDEETEEEGEGQEERRPELPRPDRGEGY